jgi:hypothetical protein
MITYDVGTERVDDEGRTWRVAEWGNGVRYWSDGRGAACPLGSGPEAPAEQRRPHLLLDPEYPTTYLTFQAPLPDGTAFTLVCICGRGMLGGPAEHSALCYARTIPAPEAEARA